MVNGILVGVDGSEAALTAVAYAASEAQRQDLPLHLLHVVAAGWLLHRAAPRSLGSLADEYQRGGRVALAEARRSARAILGNQPVATSMQTGDRVRCLVRAAREESLVVLGNERRGLLDRLVTGSVVNGVAAHSPAPVIVVPDTWTPTTVHDRVVVGVKDYDSCEGLIRHGLAVAAGRGARLHVLHACDYPPAYDPGVAAVVPIDLWLDEARAALSAALSGVAGEFPQVAADIGVEQGQPARRLLLASARADLLLLERRGHLLPIGHLGGTARALLRDAHCPVEVLPAVREVRSDDLVLEKDGGIEKAVLHVD
ncbi:universal stress protein [Nocardioides humi]|uniref:Universal stress protein n=1 Tax=Nocardioides humi TaxID=449461 RepID=A0ABN2BNG9_9ACTN|nr:universal stress protein [Nocardioides humi]